MRPVLVGFLLVVDAFAVAALAVAHSGGWFGAMGSTIRVSATDACRGNVASLGSGS
jgi:hypothetical protein